MMQALNPETFLHLNTFYGVEPFRKTTFSRFTYPKDVCCTYSKTCLAEQEGIEPTNLGSLGQTAFKAATLANAFTTPKLQYPPIAVASISALRQILYQEWLNPNTSLKKRMSRN